jgi:site-specific recombinase XerD
VQRRTNRGAKFPPEVLSPAEVAALFAACSSGPAGIRNRALIAVLYRAGLRISEALALEPKDLDLDAGAIRVLRGKGGRSRTVGIDPGAAGLIRAWLAARASWAAHAAEGRRGPLFCDQRGRALAASYLRVLIPRLGRRAGIEKRVHAHGLRHTHAAELRAEGVDVGIISKQLGHRSIATTARYLDHIAPWAVVEARGRRVW